MTTTYTAVYRQDDQGNWLVHLDEEPRCHTYGRTLAAARKNIAEAASVWFDVDEAPALVERIELPKDVEDAVAAVTRKRQQADQLAAELKSELPAVAARLADRLSMRDAAAILKLSHQRIAQLVEGRAAQVGRNTAGGDFTKAKREARTAAMAKTSAVSRVSRSSKTAAASALSQTPKVRAASTRSSQTKSGRTS